jgi:hypothetical protein
MTYGVWVGAGVGERVMVAVTVGGGGRVGVDVGSGFGAQADKRNIAIRPKTAKRRRARRKKLLRLQGVFAVNFLSMRLVI